MSKNIYVGIDVATKINVVAVIDQEGQMTSKPFSFSNNQPGAEELEARLAEICDLNQVSCLKVATESTSVYDFHLADYLAESKKLLLFNPEVYRFNPKLVSGFKKALKDREKTDYADALAIAERLRFGNLPCPFSSLKAILPLQRLTRYRFHLVGEIIREKSSFLTYLFLHNSSLASQKPIKRILGATSKAIISEYLSAEQIANSDIDELTQIIIKASKNRIDNPKELAKLIKKVSRESYRIRPELSKSLNLIMASSMRTIRSHQDNLKNVDKAIADELKGIRQTLTSVKGIGPVYASGIISEIGNIERFKSADALAKYAGLWWPRIQSGDFEGQDRHLKRSGNSYLRYYLVEAANLLRIHNEEYGKFYQKKYEEAKTHHHKRALVLTARKLVRLVYSLLKTKQLYEKKVS